MEFTKKDFRNSTYYINKIIDAYIPNVGVATFKSSDDILTSKKNFMDVSKAAIEAFIKECQKEFYFCKSDWDKVVDPMILINNHWSNDNNCNYYVADGFILMRDNNPTYFDDYGFKPYNYNAVYYDKPEDINLFSYEQREVLDYQRSMAKKLYKISPELANEYQLDLINNYNNRITCETSELQNKIKRLEEVRVDIINGIKGFIPETNKPQKPIKK